MKLTTVKTKLGYAPSWSPIPLRALPSPYARRPAMARPASLGQQGQNFFDSPITAMVVDATAAVTSGYIAYQWRRALPGWSTFFWVVASASFMKFLHDLSRPNR
jgi:hypothetical protein